ncbi:MAG: hypothetical protein AB7N76_19525 [Planctomycetota bacterium]
MNRLAPHPSPGCSASHAQRGARLARAPGVALVWGLALGLAGCCSLGPEDLALILDMQAASQGDAQDEGLPPEARAIGQDNYDAWSQLRRAAEGTPLPPDVRARHEARRSAVSSGARPDSSGAGGGR